MLGRNSRTTKTREGVYSMSREDHVPDVYGRTLEQREGEVLTQRAGRAILVDSGKVCCRSCSRDLRRFH
jgi:hypothetical protein